MLDDLRNNNQESQNQVDPFPQAEEIYTSKVKPKSEARFLGMTAAQRFVIVMLLFVLTCALGSFGLILTGKVVLPIF
jgi:hypothetical protein